MKKYFILAVILLLLIAIPAQAKNIRKTYYGRKMAQKGFQYFTKFGVDVGAGHYQTRFKLNKPVKDHIKKQLDGQDLSLDFLVIMDSEYESFDSNTKCQEIYKKAQKKINVQLRQDAKWSEWIENDLKQNIRQHMWYFGMGTCGYADDLLAKYGYNVIAEIQLVNSNGSQFSSEETGMITLYSIAFIFSACLFTYLGFQYITQKYREWPIIILLFSFALLVGHIFFYLLHLVNYSTDGKGSKFLQFLSYTSNISSQFCLTLLLILLSQGWTINYEKIRKFALYVPVVTLVAGLHICIMGLGFFNDIDAEFQYHPYQGWTGYAIVSLRVVAFLYFLLEIFFTMNQKSVNMKIKEFANRLRIFGGLYFISIPLAVLLSQMMAYYLQHRVIAFTTLFFQLSATAALAITFMSKSSAYQKIAMKNRTELPSAFGLKAY